jgi:hypothetical protein
MAIRTKLPHQILRSDEQAFQVGSGRTDMIRYVAFRKTPMTTLRAQPSTERPASQKQAKHVVSA